MRLNLTSRMPGALRFLICSLSLPALPNLSSKAFQSSKVILSICKKLLIISNRLLMVFRQLSIVFNLSWLSINKKSCSSPQSFNKLAFLVKNLSRVKNKSWGRSGGQLIFNVTKETVSCIHSLTHMLTPLTLMISSSSKTSNTVFFTHIRCTPKGLQ